MHCMSAACLATSKCYKFELKLSRNPTRLIHYTSFTSKCKVSVRAGGRAGARATLHKAFLNCICDITLIREISTINFLGLVLKVMDMVRYGLL